MMRKLCLTILILLLTGIGFITPVHAATQEEIDEAWDKFVDELSSHEYLSEDAGLGYLYDYDENSLTISDKFLESAKAVFSYSDGILSLNSYTREEDEYNYFVESDGLNVASDTVADTYSVWLSMITETFASVYGYDGIEFDAYLQDKYLVKGLENNLTVEQNGIEFEAHYFYSEEEYEKLYNDWIEDGGTLDNINFVNSVVYTEYKIDLVNGLKVSMDKYNFIEGSAQEFDISLNGKMSFKVDAEIDLFDKVYVDGNIVDSNNYELTEGSTIISFSNEYLKTLETGEHTIRILFTDDEEVSTQFTIIDSDVVENPSTGIYAGYGGLALVVVIISIFAFMKIKKTV